MSCFANLQWQYLLRHSAGLTLSSVTKDISNIGCLAKSSVCLPGAVPSIFNIHFFKRHLIHTYFLLLYFLTHQNVIFQELFDVYDTFGPFLPFFKTGSCGSQRDKRRKKTLEFWKKCWFWLQKPWGLIPCWTWLKLSLQKMENWEWIFNIYNQRYSVRRYHRLSNLILCWRTEFSQCIIVIGWFKYLW